MSDLANTPGYRVHYNINSAIEAVNSFDSDGNPSGGNVYLKVDKNGDTDFPALVVNWQDGPRGQGEGQPLAEPNGAFVEDVLWAALQRLEFFNESKYRDRGNSLAITHIEQALQALKDRQLERSHRNVEGKHEV
ncbi:MAG: hypothetical protein V4563_18155 [Pseudomonadota bacterium]